MVHSSPLFRYHHSQFSLDRTFDICRLRSQHVLHLYVLVRCLEIAQSPCLVHKVAWHI